MYTYNNPPTTESSIGEQIRVDHHWRASIIETKAKQPLSKMTRTKNQPMHYGKTIKAFRYYQLLDDRNTSSGDTRGLDSAGNPTVGNLYGSSKLKSLIQNSQPDLGETGGQVNRLATSRDVFESTLENMGIYMDWTRDSMDFDTDENLYSINTKMLMGAAAEMQEDRLQADLIDNAGTTYYAGDATSLADFVSSDQVVTYRDFVRMSRIQDDKRVPMEFTMLTGSTYTDTHTIRGSRFAMCGSPVEGWLDSLVNSFGEPALKRVDQYADSIKGSSNGMDNEIGTIYKTRIVVNNEMQYELGGEATTPTGDQVEVETYDDNGTDKAIAYPILWVGKDAFTVITFDYHSNNKTSGAYSKFEILTQRPGKEAATVQDPYGKTGFRSIQWWYSLLVERPERLAVMWTTIPI